MSIKGKRKYYKENLEDFSILIPWKNFVDLLENEYNFEMVNKRGSSRLFVKGEIRFTVDEPHGKEKYVDKYGRKKAIRAISTLEDD